MLRMDHVRRTLTAHLHYSHGHPHGRLASRHVAQNYRARAYARAVTNADAAQEHGPRTYDHVAPDDGAWPARAARAARTCCHASPCLSFP